jgi:ribosomal protein L35
MYLHLYYLPKYKFKTVAGKRVKLTAKDQAKEAVGYNAHRVGKEKEKMDRELLGHDGKLTEEQVLKMIDDAPKNMLFWLMILSPDPNRENKDKNVNLWQLTKKLVEWLEVKLDREIPFILAEHNDHTNIAHTHVILLIERYGREKPITVPVINQMRELAAGQAMAKQLGKAQARELVARSARQQGFVQLPPPSGRREHDQARSLIGTSGGRARRGGGHHLNLCDECGRPWWRGHECEEEEERELTLQLKP